MKSYKQLNQLKKLATVIAAKQLTGWNFFIVIVSNQTSYFFEIFLEAKELLQATAKILDQLKKHSVPYVSEWVYNALADNKCKSILAFFAVYF